jgi:cyclic beta-1,2-glucan synthetase
VVENPDGVSRGIASVVADGVAVDSHAMKLALLDDGKTHKIVVRLG